MDCHQTMLFVGAHPLDKAPTLSFMGRRSFVPRPLSEATVFDTDDESDDVDYGSPSSGPVSGSSKRPAVY